MSTPDSEQSALRPRGEPHGRQSRGWNFVFARCGNSEGEIHRSHGRGKPWLHSNMSPLCPLVSDRVEVATGSGRRSLRHDG